MPVVQCGDGCKVNINGAKLVEENLRVKSPFLRCASNAAHGKIMKSCMKSREVGKSKTAEQFFKCCFLTIR